MTVYLKHVPTGRILPYNPDVAKADDMEPVTFDGDPLPELPPDEPPMAPPVAKPRKAKLKVTAPAPFEDEADEFLSGLGGT